MQVLTFSLRRHRVALLNDFDNCQPYYIVTDKYVPQTNELIKRRQ